jgi:hypothetical protein
VSPGTLGLRLGFERHRERDGGGIVVGECERDAAAELDHARVVGARSTAEHQDRIKSGSDQTRRDIPEPGASRQLDRRDPTSVVRAPQDFLPNGELPLGARARRLPTTSGMLLALFPLLHRDVALGGARGVDGHGERRGRGDLVP